MSRSGSEERPKKVTECPMWFGVQAEHWRRCDWRAPGLRRPPTCGAGMDDNLFRHTVERRGCIRDKWRVGSPRSIPQRVAPRGTLAAVLSRRIGVGALGPEVPQLRLPHHDGEHRQGPVGVAWGAAHGVEASPHVGTGPPAPRDRWNVVDAEQGHRHGIRYRRRHRRHLYRPRRL